jgi:hypothetical protein
VRFLRDQALYCVRTGAWWVPVVAAALAIAAVLAASAQVVVPHAVYVLF